MEIRNTGLYSNKANTNFGMALKFTPKARKFLREAVKQMSPKKRTEFQEGLRAIELRQQESPVDIIIHKGNSGELSAVMGQIVPPRAAELLTIPNAVKTYGKFQVAYRTDFGKLRLSRFNPLKAFERLEKYADKFMANGVNKITYERLRFLAYVAQTNRGQKSSYRKIIKASLTAQQHTLRVL